MKPNIGKHDVIYKTMCIRYYNTTKAEPSHGYWQHAQQIW